MCNKLGTVGLAVRHGDRHVVTWLHPCRNAHRRAALQRPQRIRPDEQDRRSARHAASGHARAGHQIQALLRPPARRHLASQAPQRPHQSTTISSNLQPCEHQQHVHAAL